jgi:iron complex transport system substrate-binding protein
MTGISFGILLLLVAVSPAVLAAIHVTDDTGRGVTLAHSARRIISLAPNVTEMLFSAGAGDRIVATVEYSDYPPPARALRRIGGSSAIDFERVVALKPDLIVAWASGNPERLITRLRDLGFPVYRMQAHRLEDIAQDLVRLGRLAGTESVARVESQRFLDRYHALTARYAGRSPVRVFYQVLDPQLITVNGRHVISQILRLCGGINVFASLPVLAPVIDEEAVLDADPEAIIAGGTPKSWSTWRAHWRKRAAVRAVKRGALYRIPPDLIHRDTVRLLDGAERVCRALQDARRRRSSETAPNLKSRAQAGGIGRHKTSAVP